MSQREVRLAKERPGLTLAAVGALGSVGRLSRVAGAGWGPHCENARHHCAFEGKPAQALRDRNMPDITGMSAILGLSLGENFENKVRQKQVRPEQMEVERERGGRLSRVCWSDGSPLLAQWAQEKNLPN